MTYLLDVNVLIALIDLAHPHHELADNWFASLDAPSWATCPITENAVLRIIGRPGYRNSPGPMSSVVALLKSMCDVPGHVFWPDSARLLTFPGLDQDYAFPYGQVTDLYLLALAKKNGGMLVTFDGRIKASAIEGGLQSIFVIPT